MECRGTDLISWRLSAVQHQLQGDLRPCRTGHRQDVSIAGGLLVGHQRGGETRERVLPDDVVAGRESGEEGYGYDREDYSHSTDICLAPALALSPCHNRTLTTT